MAVDRRAMAGITHGDVGIAEASWGAAHRRAAPEGDVHLVAVEMTGRAVGQAVVLLLDAGGLGQARCPAAICDDVYGLLLRNGDSEAGNDLGWRERGEQAAGQPELGPADTRSDDDRSGLGHGLVD